MLNNILFKDLYNGETNAVLILEIVNIPDKGIFGDMAIEEAEINSKLNMGRLLSEIYQTNTVTEDGNGMKEYFSFTNENFRSEEFNLDDYDFEFEEEKNNK